METKVNFPANSDSNLVKAESKITVDEVKPHISGNEKKAQAQIRMTVSTTYPEAGVGNSLNDSIFGTEEFGFDEGQTYDEKRVAWIDVPSSHTKESVEAQLAKFPEARIYRVLSLEPILTEQQKRAMETGLSRNQKNEVITMQHYKDAQQVINPETGEAILYNGLPQYRIVAFSAKAKADVDMRPAQYASLNNASEEFKLSDGAAQPEKVQYAEGF